MLQQEITIENIMSTSEKYSDVKAFKKDNVQMYIMACKLNLIKTLFGKFRNPLIRTTGIYCLYDKNELVYVGKSFTCINTRCNQHIKNEGKIFDEIRAYRVYGDSDISFIEHYLISFHKPKYNLEFNYKDKLTIELNLDVYLKDVITVKVPITK